MLPTEIGLIDINQSCFLSRVSVREVILVLLKTETLILCIVIIKGNKMGNNPFFSIIIPAYNKSLTIGKCISSVLHQKMNDFEIIIINDGSTDNSEEICLSYTDSRISYYKQDNKGASSARNLGLDKSIGKYIIFLDADDYWGKDFLSIIYDEITSNLADIYFTGITKVYLTGEEECIPFQYGGFVEKTIFLKGFYKTLYYNHLYGYVSNKIVSLSLINKHNIRFNTNYNKVEDLDFFVQVYKKCESFYFIKTNDYYYKEYSNGTSLYNTNVNFFSLIEIENNLREWLSDFMDEEDKKHSDEILKNYAICAINEVPLNQIFEVPKIIIKINNHKALKGIYFVKESPFLVVLRTFIHQVYLNFALFFYRICHK